MSDGDPHFDGSLREPLRAALAARSREELPHGTATAAAVLVPMFVREGEVHVWLLRRPGTMRAHAGQVAFPGGKVDARDASRLDTALRETEEEVAIARGAVDVVGALDDFETMTGYVITPYVGWIDASVTPSMNPGEVDRVFAVPLRAFFTTPHGDFPRVGWTLDGEFIWGATARIARTLAEFARDAMSRAPGSPP